jgi:hypothetical protein
VAYFTVKARDADGPISLPEPMTIERAVRKAFELRDEGFTQIILTNVETGFEAEVDRFMQEKPDAKSRRRKKRP